jgi:hypothetical protein
MKRKSLQTQRLDALLNDWAARQALPAAQAETLRRAIVLTPARQATELSVAWWHQLFGALRLPLGRAIDMSRYLHSPQSMATPQIPVK